MRMFMSPLDRMRKQRARRKQLRTVLHMLSVSGVIRPGHIEPRYFEPSSHVDAFYRQHAKRRQPAAGASRKTQVGFDWTKLRQWVVTKPSRLQIEQ
jgi:hypothetical protein